MATPPTPPDPWLTWIISGGAAAGIVAIVKAMDAVWSRIRGGEQDHWKNAGELRKEWKEAAEQWKGEAKEATEKLDEMINERDQARADSAELREKNKGLSAKLARYKDELVTLGGAVSEVDEANDTAELVIKAEGVEP